MAYNAETCTIPFRCRHCGHQVGAHNGRVVMVGGVIMRRKFHGNCAKCGRCVVWGPTTEDKVLPQLRLEHPKRDG